MEWRRSWHAGALVLALACGLPRRPAAAAEPEALHERIDRMIEAGREGRLAAPATDGEFLRRASLDLTGVIPSAEEARAFLDDPSPYKRAELVDRLLDGPEFARRMQVVFDLMLMERRPDKYVPGAQWQAFLYEAFLRNTPYDQIVREILSADDLDPDRRGPAKFFLDREGDPNVLTRDVGRLFLGRDMQCNQCHDHPLIDDYKQAHYYGLYAFFNRSYLVGDETKNVGFFAEKADGEVAFRSVFKKKVEHKTGPRLLDGPPVAEAAAEKGREYLAAPGDKVRAIPVVSRRALLPASLTSGAVPAFGRNIANRLWALMMGRGLVHPLDLDHGDNPPSHPELLDLLAREFVAGKYDVKAFLRELGRTRAYARSSEPPPGLSPGELEPGRFAVAELKPLSPEQLAWSLMQATGLVAAARADVEHRLLGVDPRMRDLVGLDPKRRALGARLVEEAVHRRLDGETRPFVSQFGAAPGQSQDGGQSTVHQALYLANGPTIQGWVAPVGDRLAKLADDSAVADELYLAALTRRPTSGERAEVAAHLKARGNDRPVAIRELAWALLASTEFRFNH